MKNATSLSAFSLYVKLMFFHVVLNVTLQGKIISKKYETRNVFKSFLEFNLSLKNRSFCRFARKDSKKFCQWNCVIPLRFQVKVHLWIKIYVFSWANKVNFRIFKSNIRKAFLLKMYSIIIFQSSFKSYRVPLTFVIMLLTSTTAISLQQTYSTR